MVSALSGCHATNNVELMSAITSAYFNPLFLVLFGIKMPRKKDSSRNEGNTKSVKGRNQAKLESIRSSLNRPELRPTMVAINPYINVATIENFNDRNGDVLIPAT